MLQRKKNMKRIRIGLKFKGKKIEVEAKRLSKLEMVFGLMFKRREKARALFFNWKNIRIHSCFVFFPFVALWLDTENNVVDMKLVKPFKLGLSSRKSCRRLLEIPLNESYREIVSILVGGKHLKRINSMI